MKAAAGMVERLTSPGPAAIAVVRVRGEGVREFVEKHVRIPAAKRDSLNQVGGIVRAVLVDETGEAIDDILISSHAAAPAQDLRLHLHGSPWLVQKCEQLAIRCGLESTIDASGSLWPSASAIEAEALQLMPEMPTLAGVKWLASQIERLPQVIEEIARTNNLAAAQQQCRDLLERRNAIDIYRKPLRVALLGPPNAGKSTLANALADRQVAIVSATPGTTRDWIEIASEAEGVPLVWLDTAGLRTAADPLESAGIEMTRKLAATADVRVAVLDAASDPVEHRAFLAAHFPDAPPEIVVFNKTDAHPTPTVPLPTGGSTPAIDISALHRTGLGSLATAVLHAGNRQPPAPLKAAPFTKRQCRRLTEALSAKDQTQFAAALAGVLHAD